MRRNAGQKVCRCFFVFVFVFVFVFLVLVLIFLKTYPAFQACTTPKETLHLRIKQTLFHHSRWIATLILWTLLTSQSCIGCVFILHICLSCSIFFFSFTCLPAQEEVQRQKFQGRVVCSSERVSATVQRSAVCLVEGSNAITKLPMHVCNLVAEYNGLCFESQNTKCADCCLIS